MRLYRGGNFMDKITNLINNRVILQSNTSGPFIIKEDLGIINSRRRVLIEFINTGSLYDVLLNNAINHRVSDHALDGLSMDFDSGRFDDYDNYINGILKVIYKHMIDRYCNINDHKYKSYGESGVKICDSWLASADNFIVDAKFIDGFDKFYKRPFLYQLDKDYKQIFLPKNMRVYSKETCMFLYYQDNANLKIIDNNNGGYYGVEYTKSGNYYARIKINRNRYNIGTFSNPIAAANAYNYWQLYFHNFELVPLLNKVSYMSPEEFMKYNVNQKQMCIIK
jgi:hypothetical protein